MNRVAEEARASKSNLIAVLVPQALHELWPQSCSLSLITVNVMHSCRTVLYFFGAGSSQPAAHPVGQLRLNVLSSVMGPLSHLLFFAINIISEEPPLLRAWPLSYHLSLHAKSFRAVLFG